ncbi:GNAT family N-acetyltransferase [Rhodoferax sp. AJA081-3]|uniref:GNAT family N-acetyltransferase n=1 Tax=Rhodoferax sp. AJA081-3 TaxID=2752316 RepID=UPI001ADF7C6D|nr:GNAT family N-acetyltransferase [Rhodoferax sp. AJA081-3]QTN28284.1 GNAT family N-acetyltransferase [Rhodoferax sp. AJA081-3]
MPTQHPTLTDTDIANIERATLDAVAPPAVEAIDHWLLPFDTSTIGRAKSAVPLRHHTLDAAQIAGIEALYAARGLQAAFRVADVPGLANIHAELQRLGYRADQPTLVQVGTVHQMRAVCQANPADTSTTPTPEWSAIYLSEGFDPVDGAHRIQALSRSRHLVYASVQEAGQAVAAGTASLSQGWASIHGMRTAANSRGRGLAARVLAGLADAAAQQGLERVFLQVEEGNHSALALYRRARFATAWRYHYWRKP